MLGFSIFLTGVSRPKATISVTFGGECCAKVLAVIENNGYNWPMKFNWTQVNKPDGVSHEDWASWKWQIKHSLKSQSDFETVFQLTEDEFNAFSGNDKIFKVRVSPYYAAVASHSGLVEDPVRQIILPKTQELLEGEQSMLDPLGENDNRPQKRIIHRYSDRCLFLVTDFCNVYCRYCTRKHFTGQEQVFPKASEYEEALEYIKNTKSLREVILSGGDPLTLSDAKLEKVLSDLREISHIEIIRIGSRMPVVNPFRVTPELVSILKKHKPVYLMTHFNHPQEITEEAAKSLELLVDNGVPVYNQMVLLNGINNDAAIVQALSRRLLYLRVRPYYMFQCDPSEGTDHLRTSIEDSLQIQKELWGHMSGLAMPNLSLDIPDGGGKVGLTPNFTTSKSDKEWHFKGWDNKEGVYKNPLKVIKPNVSQQYKDEWQEIKSSCSLSPLK